MPDLNGFIIFVLLIIAVTVLEYDLGLRPGLAGGAAQGIIIAILVRAYFRAYP